MALLGPHFPQQAAGFFLEEFRIGRPLWSLGKPRVGKAPGSPEGPEGPEGPEAGAIAPGQERRGRGGGSHAATATRSSSDKRGDFFIAPMFFAAFRKAGLLATWAGACDRLRSPPARAANADLKEGWG